MSIDGRATRRALNTELDYYSLEAAEALGLAGVSRLPCSLKVVLENVLRQHAEGRSDGSDIAAVAGWLATRRAEREIAFRFTRVLMPDSSGVPLLGDLAAMRDAMIRLGGEPKRQRVAARDSADHVDVVFRDIGVGEEGLRGLIGQPEEREDLEPAHSTPLGRPFEHRSVAPGDDEAHFRR